MPEVPMSLTAEHAVPPVLGGEAPQCYEICIRTWTPDRETAFDLAIQISESLADNDRIDATATTIGVEEEPMDKRERVYIDVVGPPPELELGTGVAAMGT
jgi:hypothetical protein